MNMCVKSILLHAKRIQTDMSRSDEEGNVIIITHAHTRAHTHDKMEEETSNPLRPGNFK